VVKRIVVQNPPEINPKEKHLSKKGGEELEKSGNKVDKNRKKKGKDVNKKGENSQTRPSPGKRG